jgi:hypothetical protein
MFAIQIYLKPKVQQFIDINNELIRLAYNKFLLYTT